MKAQNLGRCQRVYNKKGRVLEATVDSAAGSERKGFWTHEFNENMILIQKLEPRNAKRFNDVPIIVQDAGSRVRFPLCLGSSEQVSKETLLEAKKRLAAIRNGRENLGIFNIKFVSHNAAFDEFSR